MRTIASKRCVICQEIYWRNPSYGIERWKTSKYCSRKCFGVYNSKIMKNRYINKENHPRWKGDKVGYFALHDWVEKILGKPNECMVCGTKEKRAYHWANLSGRYLRRIFDWKRMCVSCHRKYDYQMKKGVYYAT